MGKTTAEQECAHVVKHGIRLLLLGISPKLILKYHVIFPQQRKLMGSSAQIASVCAGAGRRSRFRRVPVCAGVGSGGSSGG